MCEWKPKPALDNPSSLLWTLGPIGQQKPKHLVSSVLWGDWCFIDNPSRLIGLVTELARCVGIVCPSLSLPSMLLDGSRHEISMFEDDVHEQKLPPSADCGCAPDVSSIIMTAKSSPDPRLGCLGLSCHLLEGVQKPRDPGSYYSPL